ncbi:hypothetical protein ABMA27_008607 [Loxostege sticticalis]|uniref:tyrosinase n=1 Tax=Loxostege sticticalis TaxID=481309 RepID=A0ABR3HBZ5_LOXSC
MADISKSFELLFDRPNEPLISPKGENNALFQLTEQHLPKDYESNGIELNERFGDDAGETIPLQNLTKIPQFPNASQLPTDADFSLFLPKHQKMATEVIDVLLAVPQDQLQELLSTCVYARTHLNPQLFNYSLSVVLMHRRDTKGFKIPNYAETFPSKFLDSQVFSQAREMAAVVPENVPRIPITIPRDFTASDLDWEHRLAYWREDIGINLHHWHWHLVYPFTATDRSIVAKDRRGELFFYMHQQMIARYNCERLINNLKRVEKFSNFRAPIPEAYFPKLDSLTSSRGWPPRQANMVWQDVDRPADDIKVTLDDMELWRTRIEEAISTGRVRLPNGDTTELNIDLLGNILEASILSPNPDFYGSLHNNGHNFAGYMHDPKHRYLESFAVMAEEAANMRDPFFYRWHAFVDDVFQRHKESAFVRPYSQSELDNPGVQVVSASIQTQGSQQQNELNTFWMLSDVDLSRGLDFSNRGPVYARFTHLNHKHFQYVINVNNTGNARRATVRIFICPKVDERNQPWILSDQRKMFIEMDRFVTPLNAGENRIVRQSTESEITIPFEQTFRDLSIQREDPKRTDLAAFNFCGCGWPQHMLVPKGTEAGTPYVLFVMLSNYEFDAVERKDGRQVSCVEASSFCGLRDALYPDKRAMGFPFDRPSNTATNIEDFLTPNMFLTDITIRLQSTPIVPNPRNPTK